MKKSTIKKNILTEAEITSSLRQLVELMQVQTKNNLVAKSKDIKLERDQLEKIANIVDASIMNAFTRGIDSVLEKIVRN